MTKTDTQSRLKGRPLTIKSKAAIYDSELAQHLRAWRAARDITAAEAASLIGVSPTTYGHWERGRPMPYAGTISLLITLLDERDGITKS